VLGYHRIVVLSFLSPTSTHSPFLLANTLFIRTFPCRRRLWAGSSIFVRTRFVRSLLLLPPGLVQLTHLLYSGIPYSSVIYLCAKHFLPYLLLQLLRDTYNLGGVDAKSSLERSRVDPYLSSLGRARARPTFIIALLVFSQVYNRVISEWSIGLFISISGSRPSYSNSSGRRPSWPHASVSPFSGPSHYK